MGTMKQPAFVVGPCMENLLQAWRSLETSAAHFAAAFNAQGAGPEAEYYNAAREHIGRVILANLSFWAADPNAGREI